MINFSEKNWIREKAIASGQGQSRIKCPYCSPTRKNKHDTPLSLTVDEKSVVYNCHHCNETGHAWLDTDTPIHTAVKEVRPVKVVAGELSEVAQRFLRHRGINIDTAKGLGLFSGIRYSRKAQKEVERLEAEEASASGPGTPISAPHANGETKATASVDEGGSVANEIALVQGAVSDVIADLKGASIEDKSQ